MSSENNWIDRMINALDGSSWSNDMWDGDWKYLSAYCTNGIFKVELWKEKPQLFNGRWIGSNDRREVVAYNSDEINETEYELCEIVGDELIEIDGDGIEVVELVGKAMKKDVGKLMELLSEYGEGV